MAWFYLLSGLFLGWNLGANDAGNIFGTATSTKVLKYTTAVVISSIFVLLGAMISGYGATHTIGELGDVNAIAGSFTVSLSAALTVFLLMKKGLVVSVSQSIIGAIVGWNIFTSSPTDIKSLAEIISSWILNPVLAGVFSFAAYYVLIRILKKTRLHLLETDQHLKRLTILVIAFGAYSLGANNISKVVGVFMSSSPFTDIRITETIVITGMYQLFFTGALSIVIGIITYSNRTTETVGKRIFKLTPLSSISVIFGASLVLFLFSSTMIEKALNSVGLPSFPLVPVSITQAIVGGVMGIGFAKSGRYLNFKILGKIGLGWIITPLASAVICLIFLFIAQNVFNREVYKTVSFVTNKEVIKQIEAAGIPADSLLKSKDTTFNSQQEFRYYLSGLGYTKEDHIYNIFKIAKLEYYRIDSNYAKEKMSPNRYTPDQINSVKSLHNQSFNHKWMLINNLKMLSEDWQELPAVYSNEYYNKELRIKLNTVCEYFYIK